MPESPGNEGVECAVLREPHGQHAAHIGLQGVAARLEHALDGVSRGVLLAGHEHVGAVDQAHAPLARRAYGAVAQLCRGGRMGCDAPRLQNVNHGVCGGFRAIVNRHGPGQCRVPVEVARFEVAGPVAHAEKGGLVRVETAEEGGGARVLELGVVKHGGGIALQTVTERAAVTEERARPDFTAGDEVRIVAGAPQRVGHAETGVVVGGAGPVHGAGMAEDYRDGAINWGAGDKLQEAYAGFAAHQSAREEFPGALRARFVLGVGVDGVVVDTPAAQRRRPQFTRVVAELRGVELVVPDRAAPALGERRARRVGRGLIGLSPVACCGPPMKTVLLVFRRAGKGGPGGVGDDGRAGSEELLGELVIVVFNGRIAFAGSLEQDIDGGLALPFASLFARVHEQTVAHEVPAPGRVCIGGGAKSGEPEVVLVRTATVARGKPPFVLHEPGQRQAGVLLDQFALELQEVRRINGGGKVGEGGGHAGGAAGGMFIAGDADPHLLRRGCFDEAPGGDILHGIRQNPILAGLVCVDAHEPSCQGQVGCGVSGHVVCEHVRVNGEHSFSGSVEGHGAQPQHLLLLFGVPGPEGFPREPHIEVEGHVEAPGPCVRHSRLYLAVKGRFGHFTLIHPKTR